VSGSGREIAVIGAGIKAPGGVTLDDLWKALLAGRPAIAPYSDPGLPDDISVLVAAATEFDGASYVTKAEFRRLDRLHLLAIGAADDALRDCTDRPEPGRCAIVCGAGLWRRGVPG
jgi:3-oxoacyl-[acyl-carrier-protein] synthase II